LTLLRQKPPENYRLGPHDVLGIWIEGVLGERNQLPPVNFTETRNLPPAVGFPITIRFDGTISLPYIEPVSLQGLSIEAAQQTIRASYLKAQILKEGRERVLVTLLRRRVEQILVFREDATSLSGPTAGTGASTRSFGVTLAPGGTPASLKRGTGFAVDLPAYENDVLHALAQTGGLPGLDAVNEVVIERGSFQEGSDREMLLQDLHAPPANCVPHNGGTLTVRADHSDPVASAAR
jgi:protein involved in polysaccharide export with SLBB domain